jgi:hypothetical protein
MIFVTGHIGCHTYDCTVSFPAAMNQEVLMTVSVKVRTIAARRIECGDRNRRMNVPAPVLQINPLEMITYLHAQKVFS